jgi:simple sugar transport system permease protein
VGLVARGWARLGGLPFRQLRGGHLLGTLASLGLALAAATLAVAVAGFDVAAGYRALWQGAFGSPVAVADVLARSTPLIFTGLSVAVAFRAGLFNVGAEGQLLLGAMAAVGVGLAAGFPAWLHAPLALAAAAVAGAAWGALPAFLKARFRAHEVITTIMLNYVAALLTGYLVNYPLHPPGELLPATARVAESAQVPRILPGSQLSLILVLAVICAAALHVALSRTVLGYEIRAVGLNAQAARAAGISQTRAWVAAMALAGAAAGLGGAGEALAVHRRFIEGFSPGFGFDGIAVALIGASSPLGVIPAALVLGAIRSGAVVMDRTTDIPADFVVVIQGLILVFLSVPGLLRLALERYQAGQPEAGPPAGEAR